MPSQQSTFDFPTDAMSWVYTTIAAGNTGGWIATTGTPASGCLFSASSGSGVNTTGYWRRRGTFNAILAVPTSSPVISIGAAGDQFNWRCSSLAAATNAGIGPLQLLTSGSSAVLATLFNQTAVIASAAAWSTGDISSADISAQSKTGNSSVVLSMGFKHGHSAGSSRIYFNFDTLKLTVEWMTIDLNFTANGGNLAVNGGVGDITQIQSLIGDSGSLGVSAGVGSLMQNQALIANAGNLGLTVPSASLTVEEPLSGPSPKWFKSNIERIFSQRRY